MKYKIFGRKIEILKIDEKWKVFILSSDGKKRPANDIFIPSSVKESEIEIYLEDLLHEWASPENDKIIKIE